MRNERLYKFSRELIKNLNYAYFALERADYKSSLCYRHSFAGRDATFQVV